MDMGGLDSRQYHVARHSLELVLAHLPDKGQLVSTVMEDMPRFSAEICR